MGSWSVPVIPGGGVARIDGLIVRHGRNAVVQARDSATEAQAGRTPEQGRLIISADLSLTRNVLAVLKVRAAADRVPAELNLKISEKPVGVGAPPSQRALIAERAVGIQEIEDAGIARSQVLKPEVEIQIVFAPRLPSPAHLHRVHVLMIHQRDLVVVNVASGEIR